MSPAPPPRLAPFRAGARLRARARAIARPRPELAVLVVLAGVLNLWGLARNGWANEYYSAAVRSMSSSWHAFLYGSFDPSGVMTVDKPPLALWVQVAFVKLFGFHPLSMLVPEALMGVVAVALVYDLVRRRFGRVAGFVAGVALATTPIAVAISRHNNPDALLILCSVAALWFVVRGLEDGRMRWLVLAGVCVGLGFETKMAAAFMVVPGIAAAWLWVAPRGRGRAAGQLLAGGGAMVAVGLAWPLLVALTPAADRPWVSGTSDNSIWSLILDYNGLGRIAGQAGGPQASAAVRAAAPAASSAATRDRCGCSTPASAARPAGCSASRWPAASRSSSRAACAAPTRGPAGSSPSAARSRRRRWHSASRAASSTPTTSRCSRPSRRRPSARGAAGWAQRA